MFSIVTLKPLFLAFSLFLQKCGLSLWLLVPLFTILKDQLFSYRNVDFTVINVDCKSKLFTNTYKQEILDLYKDKKNHNSEELLLYNGFMEKIISHEDIIKNFGSSDKESSDKESSDKESSDKESSDKESSDKESSDKESSDKEFSDKEFSDKEFSDKLDILLHKEKFAGFIAYTIIKKEGFNGLSFGPPTTGKQKYSTLPKNHISLIGVSSNCKLDFYAEKLLKNAEKTAKKLDADYTELFVESKNLAIQTFYKEKLGFKEVQVTNTSNHELLGGKNAISLCRIIS